MESAIRERLIEGLNRYTPGFKLPLDGPNLEYRINIFLSAISPLLDNSVAISFNPIPDFTSKETLEVFFVSFGLFTAIINQKNRLTIMINKIPNRPKSTHFSLLLFFFFEIRLEDDAGCILVDDFSIFVGETFGDSLFGLFG
jgi:hypothetical protein